MQLDSNQAVVNKKKIKLLFLTTGLGVGGAEVMLYNLLSNIDRNHFEPTVISLMDKGIYGEDIEQLNVPVHCVGMSPGKTSITSALRTIELIKQVKPDVIQGWMYHANLAAILARFLTFKSIPTIWNIRHSLYSLDYEKKGTAMVIRLLSKLSSFPSKIIYNSQIGGTQHEKIGYKSNKTIVIPNGFDINLLKPSSDNRHRLRQELSLTEDAFLIGRICRFHLMKDHETFLRAAAILLQKNPDLHFVLAGTNVDHDNSHLSELLNELNIGDRTHLLGERKDVPYLTSALDIATSSSYFGEAFPNVVGEAMACEVPCVVTDVGDSALIVGDTGKVVPPKNPQAFADACQELISLEKSDIEALGKKARQKVIELYSLESIIGQYEELYQSVVS